MLIHWSSLCKCFYLRVKITLTAKFSRSTVDLLLIQSCSCMCKLPSSLPPLSPLPLDLVLCLSPSPPPPSSCAPHIPSLPSIQGKGGKFCHLRVHILPDNYVYFESMEHPGQYVTMTSTGSVGNPVHAGPNDKNTQFFVRVEVRGHFYGIRTDFSVNAHIKWKVTFFAALKNVLILGSVILGPNMFGKVTSYFVATTNEWVFLQEVQVLKLLS